LILSYNKEDVHSEELTILLEIESVLNDLSELYNFLDILMVKNIIIGKFNKIAKDISRLQEKQNKK
jgi:hypothetical protein